MPVHLTELIIDYIVQNANDVTDLFHAWDKDHNGLIDKAEFRTFLNGVGFIVAHVKRWFGGHTATRRIKHHDSCGLFANCVCEVIQMLPWPFRSYNLVRLIRVVA